MTKPLHWVKWQDHGTKSKGEPCFIIYLQKIKFPKAPVSTYQFAHSNHLEFQLPEAECWKKNIPWRAHYHLLISDEWTLFPLNFYTLEEINILYELIKCATGTTYFEKVET